MGFFDNMSKTISDAGQGAIKKGKDMADIARFNSQINDEEKKIVGIYEQIGKQYVELYKDAPDEAFAELFALLKESKDKIEECRKNIMELKGVSSCPTCGAEMPNDALFCATCGTKMPEQVVEQTVEPANEEKHCTECGALLPAESKFCTSCGKPV